MGRRREWREGWRAKKKNVTPHTKGMLTTHACVSIVLLVLVLCMCRSRVEGFFYNDDVTDFMGLQSDDGGIRILNAKDMAQTISKKIDSKVAAEVKIVKDQLNATAKALRAEAAAQAEAAKAHANANHAKAMAGNQPRGNYQPTGDYVVRNQYYKIKTERHGEDAGYVGDSNDHYQVKWGYSEETSDHFKFKIV